jgi:hypothetical protein
MPDRVEELPVGEESTQKKQPRPLDHLRAPEQGDEEQREIREDQKGGEVHGTESSATR